MGQQQSQKSFSVGTKLLLSVLTLLVLVIGFLNISTILLLRSDKQRTTLQSKLTEAVLVGKEFANTASHVMDTLRLSWATNTTHTSLQSVVDSQSDATFLATGTIDSASGKLIVFRSVIRKDQMGQIGSNEILSRLTPESGREAIPELRRNGYAFLNLSIEPKTPLLGIVASFGEAQNGANEAIPVVFGVVSLSKFEQNLPALELTIATQAGRVLFDTDATALYSRANISQDPLFLKATHNVQSGTEEYETKGVRYLGSHVSPGYGVVVLTRAEWRKAMEATYALTEKFILLGLIGIAAAVLFAIYFSKTLTAPINSLLEATKEVARGNFNLSLDESREDEIGALTKSFKIMSNKIHELLNESVEKVLLENELDIASTVQENLLPPPVFRNDRVQIHSYYQAASRCGGDWWGLFQVGDKLVVGIADATGHGIPCALMTAAARGCFSVLHKMAEDDPTFTFSPSRMLSIANRVVYEANGGKINMTFFLGVLDFSRNVITYANAGHNPPWLFRRTPEGFKLKSLVGTGPRLGEIREYPAQDEKSVALSQGDILFLYTDGLMEGKGKSGHMYGKKRMRAVVESNVSLDTDQVVDNLIADFFKHKSGVFLDDDVTIAAAKILAPIPGPGPQGH